MIRIFCLGLLLAFSVSSHSQINTIQFQGLAFPLYPGWSNLTILPFGFGVRTDETARPTGPGTLSVSELEHNEYMIELEDGTQVSMIALLEDHLLGKNEDHSASAVKSGITQSFQSASPLDHRSLSIFVEDSPYLPNQFKAYIIRANKNTIEVSASMTHEEFSEYLMEVRPAN